MKAALGVLFAACLWLSSSGPARAQGSSPESQPSVFSYGARGLWVGALGGLATGYIVARHDGFESDDWRPLVMGTGIGALTGAGVGLTLGFVDLADGKAGTGAMVLRDMLYGAGLGALLGLITGSLVIIRTHNGEHAAFGTAIGTLAGMGLGLGMGITMGYLADDEPQRTARVPRYHASLGATRDVSGGLALGPVLSGSF